MRYKSLKSSSILLHCTIIFSGILLSLSRPVEHDSVLSGLAYGGYVVFPESGLAYSSLMIPNLTTVISSFWLTNTLAVGVTNFLLTFTGFLLFIYAQFLILRRYFDNRPELVLIAIVLTLWNPVYDLFSTAYPAVLPGTTTTFGLFGIGLAFITISNLLARNYVSAGIYFGLLFGTHLTFFMITSFLASSYFLLLWAKTKTCLQIKQFISGSITTSFLSILLYLSSPQKFRMRQMDASEEDLYRDYLANIDVHRDPTFEFPSSIPMINIAIVLFILILIAYKKIYGASSSGRLILIFLFGFGAITLVVYLIQIVLSENLSTSFFHTYMLWRFTNLFGLVLSPFVIVTLVLSAKIVLEKAHFNLRFFGFLANLQKISIVVVFLLLIRAEFLGGIEDSMTSKNASNMNQMNDTCLSNSKLKVALTSPSLSREIITRCRQPILLLNGLDNIPYQRGELKAYDSILRDIYNLKMEDPPNHLLHSATLSDVGLEALWVKITPESWALLSSRFGFQEVIVPRTWQELALCKIKNGSKNATFVRYTTKSICQRKFSPDR